MKLKLLLILFLLWRGFFLAQETNIPDDNFENYLETHDANGNTVVVGDITSMGNGVANDGLVLTSRISTVTSLNISSKMIADITGIENFNALEILDFSGNGVGDFDLSNNINLKELNCVSNGISSIDIAANVNLEILKCSDNSNTSINVSNNSKLKVLEAFNNIITILNLGNLTTLEKLYVSNNRLTSIDISNLSNLTELNCDTNYNLNITDFSPLTSLVNLNCSNTNLRSLNLSNNASLETLKIDFMSGFDVDLSNNTALTSLSAQSSDLTSLNMKNGNNANIILFDARFNQFTCISVDDPTASYLSTWQKDSKASFEVDCSETSVPDTDFEYYLENHDANGNVVAVGSPNSMGNGILDDGKVFTSRIKNVTTLDLSGNSIGELNGLEAFEALQILDCSENNFNDFDFSQLPKLTELYIHDLFFPVLDLSSNLLLEKLIYNKANSTTLTLGSNTVIKELNIGGNNITSFDVSTYTTLEVLNIDDNFQILPINVAPLTSLKELKANNTSLRALDVSQNLLLETLFINQASGFDLDLSNNTALTSLSVRTSDMSGINIQNGNNANITLFDAEQNSATLRCIQVDDSNASYLTSWNVDSGTIFNLDCGETYVPDANFENYLETHDADGNVVAVGDATSMGNGIANDDNVYTSRINSVINLDISKLTISNATGIENFVALENFSSFENPLTTIDLSKNTALRVIHLNKNNLTALDVSKNTLLTELRVTENNLTSLDLSQNSALTTLSCSRNQLNNLNVTNNTQLKDLFCYSNPLRSLDVTKNLLLENLDCVDTQLTSLDVTQNLELLELQVYENALTSLNVTNNVKLIELYAEYNQITSLDVSKNVALTDLSCPNNQLTFLNIRNGNNTNLDTRDFDISNNPGLTCVSVDDITYANTNFTKKDAHTSYNTSCNTTYVPDDNFENYLETHSSIGLVVSIGDPTSMGNGIANDDYVGTEKIQNITSLNLNNLGINDFTGLEGFIDLEKFRASNDIVSGGSIDFTANTSLTEISCYEMGLTSINITGLTFLDKLELRNNNLNSIDVSSNLGLIYLILDYNNLDTIDVSTNTALIDLRFRENSISDLDISNNTNLIRLYCKGNSLSNLNLVNNTLLETLSCGENQFATIDLSILTKLTDLSIEDTTTLTTLDVSNNTNLEEIDVNGCTSLNRLDLASNTKLIEVYTHDSAITELNLSNSLDVEYLECQNGQLTSLNIKNGNNSNNIELYATGNANLLCIQVDDPTATYLTGWEKDTTTSFGGDCNWTYIPDDNFENYLETHDADNNFVAIGDPTSMGNGIANDNYVTTAKIENVINLFVQFQSITDFTGIEDFTALQVFSCFSNTINTSLDVTSNTNLTRVDCGGMGLTSINVTGLTSLERLDVSRNNLTSIDLSTNTNLKEFMISSNTLTGLDVSSNLLLEDLQVHETTLSSIDVSTNVNLTKLTASLNQLTELNLENNTLLQRLGCGRNPLTTIEVSHLTDLDDLNVDETEITTLDVSSNSKLTEFSAREMPNLNYVNLKNGNNGNITDFEVDNCPNLTCIEVDDPTASYLTSWVKDATADFAQYCRFTYVPDDNFENYLETHKENTGGTTLGNENSLGNGVIDDYVPTEKIENLTILFIENQNISDFTGLEDFTELQRFRAYGNPVNGNLDLTANVNLNQVFCWDMGLTGINLIGLTSLSQLNLEDNDINNLDLTTNTALGDIDIENNNLSSLDLTKNTEITGLNYANNGIQTIDLSQNIKLVTLKCFENTISTIDLQNNTAIETLEIGNNPLTSLDVSIFSKLVNLKINNTSIGSIDLSNNPDISQFVCNDTAISELDLSNNANMHTLEVHNNVITELDLGNLTRLNTLNCANNQLTLLNLRNDNNERLDNVDITVNPSLTCVEVDDPMGSYLSAWNKDITANYADFCRLTYVPNDNFEALLESRNLGNGIANDNYVYTGLINSEAALIIQDKDIADLTGIEDFQALELLICRRSNLETIDLSKNISLTHLSLVDNSLTSIDLSKNVSLEELYISDNENLGNIDVSTLSALTTLSVSNTGISTIAITNNTVLRVLNIDNNNFTSLDLSLYPSIVQLRATNNPLTSLNVANSNNANFTWFDVRGNTSLTCIQTDDFNPDSRLWYKDDTANYALYCELIYIADVNFENYLETHDANGNLVTIGDTLSLGNGIANDNQVATEKIAIVTTLNIESENIADLTGIEGFTALESLNCNYNKLTALDLSSNVNLKVLDATENDFISLDFTNYISLEEVNLRSNFITSFLVNNNPNLKKLNIGKNSLTTLDMTSCIQLEELLAHQNLLVTLDVRNSANSLMTRFVASLNPSLTCILVDDINADFSLWTKDATASYTENCNTSIWFGSNDSNWTNSGNWYGNSLPLTTNNVVVQNSTNQPIINSGIIAEMNDLTVESLANFDISDGGGVIVNGNLETNETINIESSTTTSGVFIVKGAATGNVSYKRTGLLANKWSIISAPVAGQSIKEFAENPANNIRMNTTVTPNRYAIGYYDDSQPDGSKWTYYTTTDLATNALTFKKGRGYIISRATNGGITFTGSLTTIDESVTVASGSWNSIGNPYTAYVPINNNGNKNFIQENISKFAPANVGVYVWNNTQNKYVAKSLVDSAISLTVGQGFFVKTGDGVTSLNFKENQRLHDASEVAIFSRSSSKKPSIQISVASKGIMVHTDIKYLNQATKGLDPGYDIGNFGGTDLDIYTHLLESSIKQNFTVQSLPVSNYEDMIIPLGIKAEPNLELTISAASIDLPKGTKIYLEDKQKGSFTELNESNTYKIKEESAIAGTGRFYIHTKSSLLTVSDFNIDEIAIYNSNSKIIVEGIKEIDFKFELYNVLGALIHESIYKGVGKNTITIPSLETGVYIVRIKTEEGFKDQKIIINNK